MTDYDDIVVFKELFYNKINNIDPSVEKVLDIFIELRNCLKYKSGSEKTKNKKMDNIVRLSIYNLFLVHELLLNIIFQNYISLFTLSRVLIENIDILYFLKKSSNKINSIYHDYNKLRFISVWDAVNVKKYESKYSVVINTNKDDQWIDHIKGNSRFNGFSYIRSELEKMDFSFFDGWYKCNCNFIHSSVSASNLNTALFLDDGKKYKGFIDDSLYLIVKNCDEVFKINDVYIDYNINDKIRLIDKIMTFYKGCD